MPLNYNAGTAGSPSGIDAGSTSASGKAQLNPFFWLKKAIIDSRKDQYFMPLASVIGMPKNYGKTIKVLQYVPLLDDRNINDQGIDASTFAIVKSYDIDGLPIAKSFAVQANADSAVAAVNGIGVPAGVAVKSGAGPWLVTLAGNRLKGLTAAQKAAVLASYPEAVAHEFGGNLYGSSKDIGTITGKLPLLSENGGKVNRVGFTRLQREGSIQKFGFYYEFTKESLDFDSDTELSSHLATELMNGAVQLTEAVLQKDLLAAAATVVYTGAATSDATISPEGAAAAASIVDYADMMRLSQILTDNRTPKQTQVINGSRMIDTKVIPAGRVMFVGSELVPLLKAMKDLFNNQAFISVSHYGDAGTILNGEIGTIDEFRIIQVPEMLFWAGAGATVTANAGYRATGGKYDVFPMLVVGDDSFTTIGFQTDGKTVKFNVITKMPGEATADRNDPYGEVGFSSIKWYYGILVKRPERLGMIKTAAPI